ncbi:hypothetical protein ACIHCQ_32455 [Streptomyces sp. NPDC052236]|uniref:hypothetical protein n=1 Tax=Streptomyces sp. NPDC052236 TaxID=3365686 RepID=UPI0037D25148
MTSTGPAIGIGLAQSQYCAAPGTRFRCTNTNTNNYLLLLDLIVERITDRDPRTNLERRVFAPLGPRDNSYPPAQTVLGTTAADTARLYRALLQGRPPPTDLSTAFRPVSPHTPSQDSPLPDNPPKNQLLRWWT